ncbi:MAG: transketolase [Negativicutes bacterium]|nr:transketolase [Negativicutes bacterium]
MNERSVNLRRQIVNLAYKSQRGHLASCFSVVELLDELYGQMKCNPSFPSHPERDLFILSKGHAAMALYVVLADRGFFSHDELLQTYSRFGSRFGCHPDRTKVPGVEFSTGSLGHGLPAAVGMALALKIRRQNLRRVYTLIGDGEANEGSIWEGLMVAVDQRLDNLTVIYDNNHSHFRGLQIKNPAGIMREMGLAVCEIDGHDRRKIREALAAAPVPGKPRAIIAGTVKGYGSPTMVAAPYEWHGKVPTGEDLEMLLGELNAQTV